MKCQFFDLLRRGGNICLKDCDEEATRTMPEHEKDWKFCQKHFDAMVDVLHGWTEGNSTYRHEMVAKQYFKNHPELL